MIGLSNESNMLSTICTEISRKKKNLKFVNVSQSTCRCRKYTGTLPCRTDIYIHIIKNIHIIDTLLLLFLLLGNFYFFYVNFFYVFKLFSGSLKSCKKFDLALLHYITSQEPFLVEDSVVLPALISISVVVNILNYNANDAMLYFNYSLHIFRFQMS